MLKKICFIFALFSNLFVFSQYFEVVDSKNYPCEGDYVIIKIRDVFVDQFFTHCEDTDYPGFTGPRYFKYTVSYQTGVYASTSTDVSVTSSTPIGTLTQLQQIEITPTPNNWVNPGPLILTIQGYREESGQNGQIVECFGAFEQIYIYPRKVFPSISGPNEINSPGIQTYSIGNVPGVTMNWSVPSGWTINSGQSTTSIQVTPNSNSGNVSVTTTPAVSACNYPASKAVEVTDCFTNGQTEHDFCSATNWSSAFPTSGYGSQNKWPRMIGDFDGDGNDDVIGFGNTAVVVGLSTGSSFSSSTWSTGFTYGNTGAEQLKYPRQIGDFNGDGRDDVIIFGHSSTQVGLSNGSSFSPSGFSSTSGFTYSQGYTDRNVVQTMVGDFNGDGIDDVIGFGYTQTGVGLSTGSSFSLANWSGGTYFTATTGFDDMNKYPKMIGDFNGDGKDDVVGFGHSSVIVGVSSGSSFSTSSWSSGFTYGGAGYEQRRYPRMVGDFNGDGKDDIIGFGSNAVAVGISNGTSFVSSNWLAGEEFTTADGWRVDGREIGIVSEADFGDGFPDSSSFHEIRIGDANGDGLDDIIGFYNDGVYVSYSTGSNFMCPDKVFAFSNSIGYNPPSYIRQIGNFDKTDDAIELIGFGYSDVAVMNCFNDCPPDGDFTLTPVSTRILNTNSGAISVNSYCSNVYSTILDASNSNCYEDYRIEIIRVDPTTLATIGSPYSQIPAGGGWTTGVIPNPQSVVINGLVVGNLYRIQLFLKRGSVTNVTTKFIEKKLCKSFDQIESEESDQIIRSFNAILYPNPTNKDFIELDLTCDSDKLVQLEVISATGQVLKVESVEPNAISKIDLNGLNAGAYLVKLMNSEFIEIIRFIKE